MVAVGCALGDRMVAPVRGAMASKDKRKPNILFVFTDQQTLRAMGAYGNPFLQTPAMDSLAAHGMRFENSYCPFPICGPSRASMITSRWSHETGVVFNGETPNQDVLNMGEIFREAGYQTVWAGKWHLPESYPIRRWKEQTDKVQGFDLLSFYDTNLESNWGRGDVTDPPLADAVGQYLMNVPKEPFLLCVSLHNPHDICHYPKNPSAYPKPPNLAATPPLPDNFAVDPNEPEFVKDCRLRPHYGNEISLTKNWLPDDWRSYLHEYYRMIERVDAQLGRILDTLEYAGLEEETLIIFTSDHGDGKASHQWAAKLSLYEESVSVPMIVTWFGKTPRNAVDTEHLVSGLDILPTMCDYAGIVPPDGIRGQSLRPIVEGRGVAWRDEVGVQLSVDPDDKSRMGRMIRTGRYKYNAFSYGKNPEQLFDLKKDPGEKQNLAGRPEMKKVLVEHRERMMRWLEQTGDPFAPVLDHIAPVAKGKGKSA